MSADISVGQDRGAILVEADGDGGNWTRTDSGLCGKPGRQAGTLAAAKTCLPFSTDAGVGNSCASCAVIVAGGLWGFEARSRASTRASLSCSALTSLPERRCCWR